MKPLIMLLLLMVAIYLPGLTQTDTSNRDKEAAYTKTIFQRASKIVSALAIADSVKAERITGIVANQYRNLNVIYTYRDTEIKLAKQKYGNAGAVTGEVKKLEDEANAKVAALHTSYILLLNKYLTAPQIDKIKDGMTYDVLHVTYTAMNQMIPSLKAEEKKQIMAWLIEAREHAMDAESSDKKHWWFGKYKGRINNYLSAAGYDLTKEREEWGKRIAAVKASSGRQ